MKSNIRASGDIKYVTGDEVLYKRNDSTQWHGPATVIGQVDQQVFLKHGSFYVRVHPCRMQLMKGAKRTVTNVPRVDVQNIDELNAGNKDQSNGSASTIPIFSNNTEIPVIPRHDVANDEIAALANDPTSSLPSVPDTVLTDNETNTSSNTLDDQPGSSINSDSIDTQQNSPITLGNSDNINDQSLIDNPPLNSIRVGSKIQYQDFPEVIEGFPVRTISVDSRAGKAKGPHTHVWNTSSLDGSQRVVDFSKVSKWKHIDTSDTDTNEEHLVNTVMEISKKTERNRC